MFVIIAIEVKESNEIATLARRSASAPKHVAPPWRDSSHDNFLLGLTVDVGYALCSMRYAFLR
jgi:hypothetical protein